MFSVARRGVRAYRCSADCSTPTVIKALQGREFRELCADVSDFLGKSSGHERSRHAFDESEYASEARRQD